MQWVLRIIDQPLSAWITLLIVGGSAVYVFLTVHPELLVQNSTPTGGDMGAHVWGPMYLLKHVLPHGRVSGWTPDWYAGFPAFGYYMVAPALAIIAVHVGLPWWIAPLGVLVCLAVAVSGFVVRGLFRVRKVLVVAGVLGAVLCIPVPYNIAFKFVTVAGLVSLPVSAWAFAKLADLKFPAPPLFALAALLYVYNREPLVYYPGTHNSIGTGNIIGGNMASTMAGEYSFSIALSLSLIYFGVLARGLRTGRHRALAAGLLALVGLCHLLPFFFALLATALVFVVKPSLGRLKWLVATLLTGGALASFWMFPFYWRRTYTIDMGFEQLPEPGLHLKNYLAPHTFTWLFLCAGVGPGGLARIPQPRGRVAVPVLRGHHAGRHLHAPDPAVERPGAALLLPGPVPAGGLRRVGRALRAVHPRRPARAAGPRSGSRAASPCSSGSARSCSWACPCAATCRSSTSTRAAPCTSCGSAPRTRTRGPTGRAGTTRGTRTRRRSPSTRPSSTP